MHRSRNSEAVGHLDEDDPDVHDQGREYLLEVGCLLALVAVSAVELRKATYHLGDTLTEIGPDVVQGNGGVFHHVVQQGGANGRRTQPDLLGADTCHRNGVVHIRLAGFAALVAVAVVGQFVRTQHLFPVLLVGFLEQCVDHFVVRPAEAGLLFYACFDHFSHWQFSGLRRFVGRAP